MSRAAVRGKLAHTFERFTDRARRVLVLAQDDARLLNHGFIGTEHILLGLIHEGDGVAAATLESLGVSLEAVRTKVCEMVAPGDRPPTGSPPFTPRAKKVLELALREALQLGHNYIGTEHMLLGIVREGEGVAARVLLSLGADLSRVRQEVASRISNLEATKRPGGPPRQPFGMPENRRLEPLGTEWTVRVVRAGRAPEDYSAAYDELIEETVRIGISPGEMSALPLDVTSVETKEGPGLALSVTFFNRPDGPDTAPVVASPASHDG